MNPLGFVIVFATLCLAYVAATSWSVRNRAMQRLYAEEDAMRGAVTVDSSSSESWLARWLLRAGYRGPNVPGLFVAATAVSAGVGLVVGQIYRLTLLRPLVDMMANAPGGTGDVLAAILQGGPWILFLGAALMPMTVVRTARRSRVRAIEQDLPLALELFATMAEPVRWSSISP